MKFYEPEIGWTGNSVILSKFLEDSIVRPVAGVLFVVAAIVFVIGGIGLIIKTPWWHLSLVSSALISGVVLLLFWDGNMQQLAEKGIIGLIIDVVILVAMIG